MLQKLKLILNRGAEAEAQLQVILDLVIQEFLDYTNQEEIPAGAEAVIIQMAIISYNRLGSEGLSSQGYSGVSESYLNEYPENIRKQLNRYRKLKTL